MAIYIPEHFKENNLQSLHRAIKEIQIAHVITQHQHRIEVSFLPLYLEENENILYGHIAKANTQWKRASNKF